MDTEKTGGIFFEFYEMWLNDDLPSKKESSCNASLVMIKGNTALFQTELNFTPPPPGNCEDTTFWDVAFLYVTQMKEGYSQ